MKFLFKNNSFSDSRLFNRVHEDNGLSVFSDQDIENLIVLFIE